MFSKLLRKFRKGNRETTYSWLDEPLVDLSSCDVWTNRNAMQHCLILGGPGSGKTNFVLWLILKALFANKYGMLLLCAKPSDKHMYLQWAKEAGREQDVIVFEPGGKHCLSILAWQQSATKGQGAAINIVALFSIVLEMIERSAGGEGDNPYWPRSAKECLHYACMLLVLAGESISPLMLYLLVTSSPTQGSQATDSVFWTAYKSAKEAAVSPEQMADFRLAENYFLNSFASLESKTRSIVISIVVSMLNPFIQSPLRELFGGETTISPEEVYRRRNILIVNLSPSEYFELGRIGSVVMKYLFQRALLARDISVDNQPFCIVSDEYHQFATTFDAEFIAMSRSQMTSCISVIQNLPLLYTALGGTEKAKNNAESLLGLYGTKIFSQNADSITNTWASNMLGRELKIFVSGSTNYNHMPILSPFNTECNNSTGGFNESFEQVLQANRFLNLRTPGSFAEAVIFAGGKRFQASGKPYLVTCFHRENP